VKSARSRSLAPFSEKVAIFQLLGFDDWSINTVPKSAIISKKIHLSL
jgi:hypothetical protein